MTEDETVGWHHQLNGHELKQTMGVGEGQRSLACCSLWGCEESDTTERLNTTTSYPLICRWACRLFSRLNLYLQCLPKWLRNSWAWNPLICCLQG